MSFSRDGCNQHKTNAGSPLTLETLWAARFTHNLELAKMILQKALCSRIGAALWQKAGITIRDGAKVCWMKEHKKQLLACGFFTFSILLPLAKLEPRGSARRPPDNQNRYIYIYIIYSCTSHQFSSCDDFVLVPQIAMVLALDEKQVCDRCVIMVHAASNWHGNTSAGQT